jgi:6-phosphofructokinase 2
MKPIVTLTMNPSLELCLETSRIEANRKLHCPQPVYVPGDGGINVSRMIHRLGGQSTAIFPAGGWSGDLLIKVLQREGIAVDVIRTSEPTRQNVHVTERSTGKHYRYLVPGPALGIEEWNHCLRALKAFLPAPGWVVASGSLPPGVPVDFYARVADLAVRHGFKLIVDTSGEALRAAATAGTYLLKPNVGELAGAANCHELSDTFLEGAARAIVEAKGVGAVVVSAGAAGAIVVDHTGTRKIAAPIVQAQSRIGAGDSMVAGIVFSLARGWNLDEAVRFGVAAGAATVIAPGNQLGRLEDVDRLYEEIAAMEVAAG